MQVSRNDAAYQVTAQPATVGKIAVVRVNGLGDLMFAFPALQALRETFKKAEIILLAKAWHRDFLEGRSGPVDRVVVVPPTPGVGIAPDLPGDPEASAAFLRAMRAEQFDIAIQLHGGGAHSNPFTKALGARVTVGLHDADAAPLDRGFPFVYYQPEILRCLEVVGLAGAKTAEISPKITVTDNDIREAEAAVPGGDSPLVALHAGATDPRRRWPPEHFAAVARAIARAGYTPVLTGMDDERDLTANIARIAGEPVADTAGRLSTGGLAGLLSRCRLLISNDSGPLHLAAAVGTRTVGIYWVGNLINGGPVTREMHRPVLSWRLDCPACGRGIGLPRCEHNDSFVADVSVDEVLGQSFALLGEA